MTLYLSFAAVLLLCSVHLFTPSLHFLEGTPRSIWLSFAGGVSVAYVFVHFLPELSEGQRTISGEFALALAERHAYLVALFGLIVFYGLDRLAKIARSRRSVGLVGAGRGPENDSDATAGRGVFWIHMASFGIYNALIGYLLLHREDMAGSALLVFAIAMALHFLVTDFGMNEDHKHLYRGLGRWILCGFVLLGWAVGTQMQISDAAIAVVTAFIGGGVVLNVLKEEVPSERQSRFWAFFAGAAIYSALLLAL